MLSVSLLTRGGGAPLLAILTFSVPSNLVAEYAIYNLYGPDDFGASFRIMAFLGIILFPMYALVIVEAGSSCSPGSEPSYRHLVHSALTRWARVFWARFLASVFVNLGIIALVVPGILLAIRYAFVEVLAIVEGLDGGQARRRSAELARGRSRTILRLLASVIAAAVLSSVIAGLALGSLSQIDNFATAAITDTLFDVAATCLYGGAWFIYRDAATPSADDRPDPIG